jgi:hypothetical protein
MLRQGKGAALNNNDRVDVAGRIYAELFGAPHGGGPRRREVVAYDGDGEMLGRVLIYASVIVAIVALVVWKASV